MGKAEGYGDNWHGHVTAVTVAPEFRRLGLAKKLMDSLKTVSEDLYVPVIFLGLLLLVANFWTNPALLYMCLMSSYDGYFVDLFVRVSNSPAIGMYEKLGYSVYRRVLGYYSNETDGEDAFDMRKALPRDVDKKSIIPLPHPITPDQL
ncbi:N-acetyltransferase 5, partial [Globisporangium splendens]